MIATFGTMAVHVSDDCASTTICVSIVNDDPRSDEIPLPEKKIPREPANHEDKGERWRLRLFERNRFRRQCELSRKLIRSKRNGRRPRRKKRA